MQAAFIEKVGTPKVIRIGELPTPQILESEVLVKVISTTVNHVDCYIRSGKYPQNLPNPYIIGRDFCGEVLKVGKDVHHFKVGDNVWSNCQGIHSRQGTFAQFLAVSPQTIFHLPPHVNPLEAVAVFHSSFTAILGLTREASIQAKDILYVHGAAGNIGAAVIQVGKAMGAQVIASTHGKEKTDYCYKLGADEVIDYKEDIKKPLKKFAPQGINIFWNTSRLHDFKISLPLLAPKGCYILMAGSGSEAILPIGALYTNDASIRGFTITNASLRETQQAAKEINALLEKGVLSAKVDTILSLNQTQQAHELMEESNIWGKIVLNIAES